ncbi:MAG: mannose-1-phosphate guanylyltransferase [Planctomycetota bacterium]
MLHAVIMAGGSGTRFWPASRSQTPKQLLNLAGDQTMIQSTSARLGDLVPPDRQMVVTNRRLVDAVALQLPDLKPASIVGEPCKRDTAPCVGLAAALVAHRDSDATMMVTPADHVISTDQQFQAAVLAGADLVEKDPTRIVTFGIPPTYAAESFGYVESGQAIECDASVNGTAIEAFAVSQFREKPDSETAAKYLAAGNFFWNSGIFIWKAATILDALRKNAPEIAGHIDAIAATIGTDVYEETLEREFHAIQGTSIDYAVMESYPNVAVIRAPYSWDDVGSWQALQRLNDADYDGNIIQGRHVGIDTRNCIVRGTSDHVIVTIDTEDLIVVQTEDATLIAPKHAEERVREAVKRMQEGEGFGDVL